jgi:hypothetical protein
MVLPLKKGHVDQWNGIEPKISPHTLTANLFSKRRQEYLGKDINKYWENWKST